MERALASYVKGQLALSLIIGASSGLGVWVLGMLGLMPNGGKYALLFGVWAGITELIPYVGPWLGAAPPVLYALVQHPLSALWVALLFLAHPAARRPRRRAEGDGALAAAAPAARHLRPARRRRDLRLPRASSSRCRCSPPRARCGSSSPSASRSRAGPPDGPLAETVGLEVVADKPAQPARAVTQPLLRAVGVARRYGDVEALAPTDFELVAGEAVALVGPNGAGKSTLLAILAGAIEASEGVVEAHVRRSAGCRSGPRTTRASRRARTSSSSRGSRACATPPPRPRGLLERFSLPREERPSGELSVGNRQRLNVALSLLGEPRVLLLDEPTASLDPGQRRRVWEVVNALRSEGGAVCFATQNLEEVEHADRVLVLEDGRHRRRRPSRRSSNERRSRCCCGRT